MGTRIESDKDQPEIAVIGGGLLGMTLATRLRNEGFSVEILESSGSTGGLASPAAIGDFTWDRFYHVILLSDLNLRQLLEELELSPQLRWGTTRTGFYTDSHLYSLSNSLEFLRFPPLSLIDKFRLGWTIFRASRIKNWRKLEQIPVDVWLARWSGKHVYERIWLPLLRSKLGDNHQIASAAFIWAIIQRMYAARQSGLKREMFGYVSGGYNEVLKRLRAQLDQQGVVTKTSHKVSEVVSNSGIVTLSFGDGSLRKYRAAILTVPTPMIAEVCPQLSACELSRLRGITYQGIVCASVLLRKPLSDFYITNVTDSWVPFTGVIEMTALVDRSSFGGNSLVYLPRYLAQDDPFWDKSDEAIRDEFLSALSRMYPTFAVEDVIAFRVSRARNVLAISTLGYSETLMPEVETSVPGIYILNTAQIAHGTLNVNETLALVRDRLPELISNLRIQTSE